jgi:proteic killer suppression protein
VIASYADKNTEKVARGIRVKKFEVIAHVAQRKLRLLMAATSLDDLRIPPGNHLEALAGDRKGQFSIRINDRYRICFTFEEGQAYDDVEIVDYHP